MTSTAHHLVLEALVPLTRLPVSLALGRLALEDPIHGAPSDLPMAQEAVSEGGLVFGPIAPKEEVGKPSVDGHGTDLPFTMATYACHGPSYPKESNW